MQTSVPESGERPPRRPVTHQQPKTSNSGGVSDQRRSVTALVSDLQKILRPFTDDLIVQPPAEVNNVIRGANVDRLARSTHSTKLAAESH